MEQDCSENLCPAFFNKTLSYCKKNNLSSLIKEAFGKELWCQDCKFIYLHCGGVNVESNFESYSLTQLTTSICRDYALFPSLRSILLPIYDQHLAMQLSLAQSNKEVYGDFEASASDVLYLWQKMCNLYLKKHKINEAEDIYCDDDTTKKHECYKDLISSFNCVDHFWLLSCVRENLKLFQSIFQNLVMIIDNIDKFSVIEKEMLNILLLQKKVYEVNSSFCECSKSELHNTENDSIKNDAYCCLNSSNTYFKKWDSIFNAVSETADTCDTPSAMNRKLLFIEQLFICHMRLALNTRDEVSLARICTMPGREISHEAFTDIKKEAQMKSMPMYQIIMSFITRLRHGSKGSQPDTTSPIYKHTKPFSELLDSMMKMQTVLEDETNERKAVNKILLIIKKLLLQIQSNLLNRSFVEKIWKNLDAEVDQFIKLKFIYSNTNIETKLTPAVKLLLKLCDSSAGRHWKCGIVNSLDNSLSLSLTSPAGRGAVQIPCVISLFKSPCICSNTPNLKTRAKKRLGIALTPSPAKPSKRHLSCLSWAVDGISPIFKGDCSPNTSFSPIIGPTLKAVGKKSRHCQDKDWKSIIASLPERKENIESTPLQSKNNCSSLPPKCSRRSLLKTIKELPEKKKKVKPLPIDQKSITAFFK